MPDEFNPPWELAVTHRCRVDDLGLSRDEDWRAALDRIPILRAFAERRSQLPEGQERVKELVGVMTEPIFTLHSERDRGGTWYDDEEEIVWLLGVGFNHDYAHLARVAAQRALMPTVADYEQLEAVTPDSFALERIGRQARALVEEAWVRQDVVVEGTLADTVSVRVCVESGNPPTLTVALSERVPSGTRRMPPEWRLIIAQSFFPGSEFPIDFLPYTAKIDATFVRSDELGLVNIVAPRL